jgi:hypothetical protein
MRSLLVALAFLVLLAPRAFADDRSAIADAATKLATAATSLAKTAKETDDRGARKKFAPAASDIADDLTALSRKAGKDVPLASVGKDAADIDKDATKLVELADEVDDKDARKSLRTAATLLEQSIASLKKQIDAAAAKGGSDKAAPAAAKRFTGRFCNTTVKCDSSSRFYFAVSANGQEVFRSKLVMEGENDGVVLYEGSYLVTFFGANGRDFLGQKQLAVKSEGWQLNSGCVKEN